MKPRIRLRDTMLTNGLRTIRQVATYGLILLCAITFLGYVLPGHRIRGTEMLFHSNLHDGGGIAAIVLIAIAAMIFVLRKGRLGAGMLTGILSVIGATAALAPVLLKHMFMSIDSNGVEGLFVLGVMGMFFGGVALLVGEPVLYWRERHVREREAMPQVPRARALS